MSKIPFNCNNLSGKLRQNEPMSKHTTWRVGGAAEWFYEPSNVKDLSHFLQQLPTNMPIFWLGLGSNLLVRDGGIKGVVILTAGLLNNIRLLDNHQLYVEAGVSSAKVARFAVREQLAGCEFLAGIPGTFGGALAMNAGAWGQTTWELVKEVATLDNQGNFHKRSEMDYAISYRSVKGAKNEWFTAATLQLTANNTQQKTRQIRDLLKQRNESQPIGLANTGSVFRNPVGDYAARLIEKAGWKGHCVGEACVSEKHANFIINHGGAKAVEIEDLIQQITVSIMKNYGIQLIPEVHIVGEY